MHSVSCYRSRSVQDVSHSVVVPTSKNAQSSPSRSAPMILPPSTSESNAAADSAVRPPIAHAHASSSSATNASCSTINLLATQEYRLRDEASTVPPVIAKIPSAALAMSADPSGSSTTLPRSSQTTSSISPVSAKKAPHVPSDFAKISKTAAHSRDMPPPAPRTKAAPAVPALLSQTLIRAPAGVGKTSLTAPASSTNAPSTLSTKRPGPSSRDPAKPAVQRKLNDGTPRVFDPPRPVPRSSVVLASRRDAPPSSSTTKAQMQLITFPPSGSTSAPRRFKPLALVQKPAQSTSTAQSVEQTSKANDTSPTSAAPSAAACLAPLFPNTLSELKPITPTLTIAQRRTVDMWTVVLSGLGSSEFAVCALVSKTVRYAGA
jgi:hypothetical protein